MKKPSPTPEEVKAVRINAGLTQDEAARLIGYDRRALQYWEAGGRTMRYATFQAFKAALKRAKP